jgi:hypothetical protein
MHSGSKTSAHTNASSSAPLMKYSATASITDAHRLTSRMAIGDTSADAQH